MSWFINPWFARHANLIKRGNKMTVKKIFSNTNIKILIIGIVSAIVVNKVANRNPSVAKAIA